MKKTRLGMSLVEVLVGMVLLTILMGIVVQFFATQSKASKAQKAINEATEAARTALTLVTWDLQNAGYRVTTSKDNMAISATSSGSQDSFYIRYFDETLAKAQRIYYKLGGTSLLRQQTDDSNAAYTNERPTVARIVAMNVQYETRADQFVVPESGACGAGETEVTDDDGNVINCSVNWVFKDTPERLVKKIRLQLLARSEIISSSNQTAKTYTFSDGSTYTAQPGYTYYFAEQIVIPQNLAR